MKPLLITLLGACLILPAAAAEPSTFSVTVQGKGAPVVLIPGLGCNGDIWKATVDSLSDRYECHVVSIKGFGGQPPCTPLPDPFLPQVRDELAAYIAEKKLGHPAIIGHSLGGIVALDLAATAPELPRLLIIVDSSPCLLAGINPAITPEQIQAASATFRSQFTLSPEATRAAERSVVRSMVTSDQDFAATLEMVQKSDHPSVRQALTELLLTDLRPALSRVRCPALILGAGLSRSDAAEEFARQYANLSTARIEIFDKSRHFLMYDEPERFRSTISKRLAHQDQ